ncbi:MAG: hypothetical protein NC819_03095 [Candidatus Omnitrophica bacterium]|nr:hypothetical protein [Candidatus Omnitrophota bacterium]
MTTSVTVKGLVMAFLLLGFPNIGLCGDAEFEQARGKLISAQKLDVLMDLKWDPKSGPVIPKVYVGRTFHTMPVDAKDGFLKTVDLFLMAGDESKHLARIDIHDGYSGKKIGAWSPVAGTKLD